MDEPDEDFRYERQSDEEVYDRRGKRVTKETEEPPKTSKSMKSMKEKKILAFSNKPLRLAGAYNRGSCPLFLYGSAWKDKRTGDMVSQALRHGFMGVDTANQPIHYKEALVGSGIRSSGVPRSHLWIQTKFTSLKDQDPNQCPYDKNAPLELQIDESIKQSLKNLRTDKLDAVLMHSPLSTFGELVKAWHAMEKFVPRQVLRLGLSNVDLNVITTLCDSPYVNIPPAIVQNPFTKATNYDKEIIDFCKSRGMIYQGFYTLKGNHDLIRHPFIEALAEKLEIQTETLLYVLIMGLGQNWSQGGGIVILNGTTNTEHMKADIDFLAIAEKKINSSHVAEFERILWG